MVRDRLLAEVRSGIDELVHGLNAEFAKGERTKGRTEVSADDALVVLLASLLNGSMLQPVVAKRIERLRGAFDAAGLSGSGRR
jgi:hypothetical protein